MSFNQANPARVLYLQQIIEKNGKQNLVTQLVFGDYEKFFSSYAKIKLSKLKRRDNIKNIRHKQYKASTKIQNLH
jgi:hypothetical protein